MKTTAWSDDERREMDEQRRRDNADAYENGKDGAPLRAASQTWAARLAQAAERADWREVDAVRYEMIDAAEHKASPDWDQPEAEVDAELRAMGVDPDELAKRGLDFVNNVKAELASSEPRCDRVSANGIRCTRPAGHEASERVPTHDERPRSSIEVYAQGHESDRPVGGERYFEGSYELHLDVSDGRAKAEPQKCIAPGCEHQAIEGHMHCGRRHEPRTSEAQSRTIERTTSTCEEINAAISDAIKTGVTLTITENGKPRMQVVKPKTVESYDDQERSGEALRLDMGNAKPAKITLGDVTYVPEQLRESDQKRPPKMPPKPAAPPKGPSCTTHFSSSDASSSVSPADTSARGASTGGAAAPNACEAWEWDGCCSRCNASLTWEGDPPEDADDAICDSCLRTEAREWRRATPSSGEDDDLCERCGSHVPKPGREHIVLDDGSVYRCLDALDEADRKRVDALLRQALGEGWNRLWGPELEEIGGAMDRLLADVRRETIEACAELVDARAEEHWQLAANDAGMKHKRLAMAHEGIAKAIRALPFTRDPKVRP